MTQCIKNIIPILLLSCIQVYAQDNNLKTDSISEKQTHRKLLIINSFDANSIQARKNKRELFAELTDSLANYLAKNIKEQTGNEPVIVQGIIHDYTDSLVQSLLKEHTAATAILIDSLSVYFDEAGEERVTGDDGKTTTNTRYNLCAENVYRLYVEEGSSKKSVIKNCEFFTSRGVNGRFVIKFGPDIVGKRKYTFGTVADNARRYIDDISSAINVQ